MREEDESGDATNLLRINGEGMRKLQQESERRFEETRLSQSGSFYKKIELENHPSEIFYIHSIY